MTGRSPVCPYKGSCPPPQEPDVMTKKKQSKTKQKSTGTDSRPDARQVRAVHEYGKKGTKEIWLYVPERSQDKSETKRKGWWLYPEKDKDGRYYIGPLQDVQRTKTTKIKDVAVFKNFPFTRTATVDANGQEIATSVRCVSDRPLTQKELELAKGGDDVDEPRNDPNDSEDPDSSDPDKSEDEGESIL